MYRTIPPAPEIRFAQYDSPALAANPLEDPIRRTLAVVLPPERFRTATARFPAIFLLSGYSSDGRAMAAHDPFNENVAEIATRLMLSGEMPPVILALPDGFTSYGGSQYFDSPAVGNYGASIADDAVAALDASFPTMADQRHRAVAGKSSGGYGALRLAMTRPDRFSACAAHAPDSNFDSCYRNDLAAAFRVLESFDGDKAAFVREYWRREVRPKDWFVALSVIAMSAAYTHRTDGSFDLPFCTRTGGIDPAIWKSWQAHDPVVLASSHHEALRNLRLLYLDAGNRDEFALDIGVQVLSKRLEELDVRHELQIFDGGHMSITWRYRLSLPKLASAITD